MSLADFSELAQIAGVIAIIASLVHVGIQLKQNTTALHARMFAWLQYKDRIIDAEQWNERQPERIAG